MSIDPSAPDFDPWPVMTAAMRELVPDMPEGAVVYEVDAGHPDDANTRMCAAVVRNGRVVGKSVQRTVAKEWLREFYDTHKPDREPML